MLGTASRGIWGNQILGERGGGAESRPRSSLREEMILYAGPGAPRGPPAWPSWFSLHLRVGPTITPGGLGHFAMTAPPKESV